MKFGTVLKFKDADRGPELSRYMYVSRSKRTWGSGLVINVVCLFVGHKDDEWEVDGESVSCDADEMERVVP